MLIFPFYFISNLIGYTLKVIEVVAAVIENEGELFCAQRNHHKLPYLAFKYEFPGGKVEAGETKEEALLREINEELSYKVEIQNFLLTVEHQYPDFRLIMHAFRCTATDRDYSLHEHIDAVWLRKEELHTLDWAAADIPIVDYLLSK